MKIRLALLESDKNYLDVISQSFESKYSDKLEMYSFTDISIALESLNKYKIDVFLADSSFEIPDETIPMRCAFSYLTETYGTDTVKGQNAICKFQKADLIYKYILNIYSEKADNISTLTIDSGKTKVIFFQSVSGEAGASSLAAAAAMRFAVSGKKVLYFNLEKFGSSNIFFEGSGQFDMSDIIFCLKNKRDALRIKLESCVKRDKSGVFFYAPPKIALDMSELENDDIIYLLQQLKISGEYDYIIADTDLSIDNGRYTVFNDAHSIIWVSDGSRVSNEKLTRAYRALAALEDAYDLSLCGKVAVIYNKFSNKTGQTLDSSIELRNLGGAPGKDGADAVEIVRWLSEMNMLDNIIA